MNYHLRLFWKKNLTSEAIIQCVWFFFLFEIDATLHWYYVLRIDIDIGIKIESTFFFGKMSSQHSYKRPWRHRKIQIVAVMLKRSPVIYWGKCSIIDSKNDKKVIYFRCGPTKKPLKSSFSKPKGILGNCFGVMSVIFSHSQYFEYVNHMI